MVKILLIPAIFLLMLIPVNVDSFRNEPIIFKEPELIPEPTIREKIHSSVSVCVSSVSKGGYSYGISWIECFSTLNTSPAVIYGYVLTCEKMNDRYSYLVCTVYYYSGEDYHGRQ